MCAAACRCLRMAHEFDPVRILDMHVIARRRAHAVQLWHLNTTFYKDRLARIMNSDQAGPGSMHLHDAVTDDFLTSQMSWDQIV